jgi:hypothetical protein
MVDAYAEANRRLAAQAAERERAARASEERSRVADATPQPRYQPQVVTLPATNANCPPGSTWYNTAGTAAPGGTCDKDPQGGSRTGTAGASASASKDAGGDDGNPARAGNAGSAGGGAAPSGAAQQTIQWGPVKPEAVTICNQSQQRQMAVLRPGAE